MAEGGASSAGADALADAVRLVRALGGATRLDVSEGLGVGRSVARHHIEQAIALGLLEDDGHDASTGGRAPRALRFRAEQGVLLLHAFGATGLSVALTDLNGSVIAAERLVWDIARGPAESLAVASTAADRLLAESPSPAIWGIGVGVPGPVDFAVGRPVAPPIMPGWDGYDIRAQLEQRYGAPVWVDNDVNMIALGEARRAAPGLGDNLLYVKVGSGIGAGIIAGKRIHRGFSGAAGDIGHIAVTDSAVCRCGQVGCLEALAGGWAIVRDASEIARNGSSPLLEERLRAGGEVVLGDVLEAAARGDRSALALLERSARLVGDTLATLVNFFNPSTVVLGGSVAGADPNFLAIVRETVYRRSLALATRHLRIEAGEGTHEDSIAGAAAMVGDELFGHSLDRWVRLGGPAGVGVALY